MAVKRTPEQEAVVKNRGGTLLVSAAAGSGKTRVLVERLLDRILYEEKNINEFLIITFTRAAAEELRGRIAGELNEAQAAHPDNAHLRRQSALLYETQISTIHAFCTVLLRQWGHLLDIPSDFTLCEEEEASVLMARTLDQILEERYEDIDPDGDFAQLLDLLTAGRDDSRLVEIVLDVYEKIQSAADPLAWLEEQRERDLAFSLLWSLKESYVKLLGSGIAGVHLDSFTVRVLSDGRARIDGSNAKLWYAICNGYVMAVCSDAYAAPETVKELSI